MQRDVSAAQFHDDLEGVEDFFFRVPRRGGRLGERRSISLSLKQILHRLQHHCDDAGLFKDEVVLGNDAHVDVERLAAQICAEDERVSDAVLDLDGKLRLLLGVKVNVALDGDLHAEGNVFLDLETEIECEIRDECREHVAHGQFAVGQTVGALELEIEAYRRGQRDRAVFGKDALEFSEVHALGHDGGVLIVDRRLDAEEGEPYHCGIGSQCEIYADISLVAFALAVEQAEIAVVGIELDEVFCVELIPAGQQCAQKRADEVRAETDLELLIRHHYAADDGKDCVEDVRHCLAALIALAVVVIVGTSVLFRGIRRNERGCLGRSFGSGCGGIWGRLFFTACEQLRDVDAGHRDLAAYDALRVGSDVKGAGAVPAGDDVDREQVSARACDLESDVGHPEDVEHESRVVGNVKLFGQTDERTQREVELRGHVVVQRECDDQPLDERLHVFFYGVAAAREVVYPRAHFPLVGAAVFYRAEGNGAGDLRIDVVKSKFGGVQRGFAVCALGESELAYVAEVVEVDVGRYDGRHVFVINARADADGQRRQRDHDVRKVADGRLRREQVAVGIGEVAPIERERRADLTYVIDADGARDGLGGGLCKLYHYTLGRDVKQQIELGLSILWRNAFVPPCRGDRGSARFGHGLFAFVALAVVVGVDVFVLEKIRDDAHEVDLDAYACAYERGRVNIEYTVAIVCRKQHFGIAVRQIVDDAHGKFGPVRPFGSVGAHQLGEYGAEVELARHGERDVYAHALGEEDLAHAFTEGYTALVQVALDAESETDVDVRLIKEVDKFDFLGDFYVALTVDDGVDAAEGETEVEVFAEADRGADGQTFGGVAARDVQAVGKRDAHADVKSEILARSIRDGDAFKIQKTQHLREHDAAYGDVHIEVAQRKLGVIRRKQREKDAHDVDAVAVRSRNGDGVTCRPRLSEEGLYVDHEGKTAEFLGSRKMQDTVHQPRAQRCRTRVGALFGELDVDVEHGQQTREHRAYICAFGQTVYDLDEPNNVGDLGTQSERRLGAEGLFERREDREQEVIAAVIDDVGEFPALHIEQDVRLQTDLHGVDAREDLVKGQIVEGEVARSILENIEGDVAVLVLQHVEGEKFYVLAVLPVGFDGGYLVVEVIFVLDRAEPCADAHAEGSEVLQHVFFARFRRKVEVDGDVLGGREAVVGEPEHDVSRDGDLPARGFTGVGVDEDELVEDVVEDLLRESDLHLLEVEDVLRHVDVDVLDDGFHKPQCVRDGFAVGGSAHGADDVAVCDKFARRGDKVIHDFLVLVDETRFLDGVADGADQLIDEPAEQVVDVNVGDVHLARAEDAGEVDKECFFGAHVCYARAHVVVLVRTGELDEQICARIVEHVNAAADVDLQRAVEPVDVDLFVEEITQLLHGLLGQLYEGAERRDELRGRDAVLFQHHVEGDGEIDGEQRIILQFVYIGESPAAVGLGRALGSLRRGQIGAHVKVGLVVVPLYAVAADGDVDVALLGAVDLFEAGADGVEIDADLNVDGIQLALAVGVIRGEIRDNINVEPLDGGKELEIYAEKVFDHVVDVGGNEGIGTGSEQSAQHAAQKVGKTDGHGKTLRAVRCRFKTGRT